MKGSETEAQYGPMVSSVCSVSDLDTPVTACDTTACLYNGRVKNMTLSIFITRVPYGVETQRNRLLARPSTFENTLTHVYKRNDSEGQEL